MAGGQGGGKSLHSVSDRDSLLAWLAEVLRGKDEIDVLIVMDDSPSGWSSVHITLKDVPGPLAGLETREIEKKQGS